MLLDRPAEAVLDIGATSEVDPEHRRRRTPAGVRNGPFWAMAIAISWMAVFLALELVLRAGGVISVPMFRLSPTIGYYPAPNQSGAFLHTHDWAYDDESLGVAAPYRWSQDGILLVGDSIVNGGNPYAQKDKLGPQLAAALGRPVWPVAAGGWSLVNEIAMLRAHPRLLALPTIVWVVNSGDFGRAGSWGDETVLPTVRPASAVVYALRKLLLHRGDVVMAPTSAAATARWKSDVDWLMRHYHGRLIVVLHPMRAELGRPSDAFAPLLNRLGRRAEVIDVARSGAWSAGYYRDGVIHPTAAGNGVLARIIAAGVARR